jgi:hypothetical protein
VDELSRPVRYTCLTLILVTAFGLRVFRLSWGLPEFLFPDTVNLHLRPAAQLVGAGDFRLSSAILVHGALLPYVLGGVLWLWSHVTGEHVHPAGPGLDMQLPTTDLIGRILCVVFALLSVAVLYLVSRRLLGTRAALFAAAVFAVSPVHVLESHRTTPDVLMVLLMLVAMHQTLIAADRGHRGRLLGAFALSGLAAAAKYPGMFAAALPAWVAVRWTGAPWRNRLGWFTLGTVVTVAGFVAGMAATLLDLSRLRLALRLGSIAVAAGMPGTDLYGQGWVYRRYLYPAVVVFPFLVGWAAYVSAIAGVVLLARRNRRALVLLAVAIGPFAVAQGANVVAVARYFLPMVPCLALFAGVTLNWLCTTWRRAGTVAASAVLAYTLVLTGSWCLRLGLGPQEAVGQLVAQHLAGRAAKRGLVVAYPDPWALPYDAVRRKISLRGVKVVFFPQQYWNVRAEPREIPVEAELREQEQRWIAQERVDLVVLPDWQESAVVRERPDGQTAGFYRRLADGQLGFRLAAYVRTRYLTEDLYTWGDPMLHAYGETAIEGYKVFVRTGIDPTTTAVPSHAR